MTQNPEFESTQIRPELNNKGKKKWRDLMKKYNLDCFSSSELDSELDAGDQYCYEHVDETLI